MSKLVTLLIPSVQFSCSVMSDSLRPHESQHARPPCPSPTPGVHSNSRPSSRWCHPSHLILSSPSPPAPNPSQHQSFSMSLIPCSLLNMNYLKCTNLMIHSFGKWEWYPWRCVTQITLQGRTFCPPSESTSADSAVTSLQVTLFQEQPTLMARI